MGIVKLMLPRFMFYRKYMPGNKEWRHNTALAWFQIYILGNLLYFSASRYKFRGALRGVELADAQKPNSRLIPIL
ncbi:hypothetical protein SteCoe_36148 [Stentor coeruleus]|uniref:Uncharacterized protein n=1 Tax=Stentor coeruleus TaxID=5963 RepID=A0A1R2AQP8_9CILI|nr:hypothetical protein SteCoe_36148 [Stentor coeruleus]